MAMRVTIHSRVREIHKLLELDEIGARVLARAADAEFRKIEAEMFAAQTDSTGAPWATLSADYKKWKDRWFAGMRTKQKKAKAVASLMGVPDRMGPKASLRGFGANKTLQLTGGMKTAFTRPGNEHALEWFKFGEHWRIRMGVRGRAAKLANWHHEGTPRMPQRDPIVAPSSPGETRIFRAMTEALTGWFQSRVRAMARAEGATSYTASLNGDLFSGQY